VGTEADLDNRFAEDTCVKFSYLPTIRAVLALNRGESGEAIELLKIAAPYERVPSAAAFTGILDALSEGR
jgi:hypothetical protein